MGVNSEPFEVVGDSGQSVDVTWRTAGGATFRSITAWRDFDVSGDQDIDFTNADIAAPTDTDESFRNFSQEFQLHGENDRLAWLVGAYIYTEDLESDEIVGSRRTGPPTSRRSSAPRRSRRSWTATRRSRDTGTGLRRRLLLRDRGWSLFSHNAWQLSDEVELVLGLRYSTEEKDAGAIINGAPFGEVVSDPFCAFVPVGVLCDNASYNNAADESKLTGTLKAAWWAADNLRLYASYSHGYKAGGFNLDQEAVGNRDGGRQPG